jgi:hypothetical protein
MTIPNDIGFPGSYVLGLLIRPYVIALAMDFVLLPSHKLYSEPFDGEVACYRRGRMFISKFSHLTWKATGTLPGTDASGERDYGTLDFFDYDGKSWRLEGEWGEITILGGGMDIHYSA